MVLGLPSAVDLPDSGIQNPPRNLAQLQRQISRHFCHLVPQPKTPFTPRAGLDGLIDSLLGAQHVLEMFRRTLPNGTSRRRLDRLSNRLTKILSEARKLPTP